MLYFILFGEVLAGVRVIIAALPLSDNTCISGLWFGHLAFCFVFGALLIKTWRVNKIVNNPTLKRVKITSHDVARLMIIGFGLMCAYLCVLTWVGEPHKSSNNTWKSNQMTKELRCAFNQVHVHTALFAVEAVILIQGARLCWAVKDVPDVVNESKYIAAAMTIIVMMSALVFPIVFLINLSPPLQQIIASVSIALGALASLVVFFLPKVVRVFTGEDLSDMLPGNQQAPVVPTYEKISKVESNQGSAVVMSTEALRHLNADQKTAFCMEQINMWRAQLMKVGEKGSNSGSDSSKSSASMDNAVSYSTLDVEKWAVNSQSGKTASEYDATQV